MKRNSKGNKLESKSLYDLYYNDLKSCKPLSRAKEIELLKLAKEGDVNARNEIIKSNLRYVVLIAKRYSGFGIPLTELISEGNMGLFKAFENFDMTKNVKFYCYAVWWIRQTIQCYIKSILESDKMEFKENQVKNDDDDLVNVNSIFDLGGSYKIENSDLFVDEIGDNIIIDYTNMDKNKNQSNEDNKKENVDLEDEEEDFNLEKTLFANPSYAAQVADELMESLTGREKEIIRKYYGFDGEAKNLEEIGTELNITQERVRQIKVVSMKKMRQEILLKPNLVSIYR